MKRDNINKIIAQKWQRGICQMTREADFCQIKYDIWPKRWQINTSKMTNERANELKSSKKDMKIGKSKAKVVTEVKK